jgi:diamine N-acetyltransferase
LPGDVVSSPGFFMSNSSILLRKLQPSDLQFLIQVETDPENLQFSGEEDLPSIAELEAYLNSDHDIILHDQLRLVIEFNRTPVGFIDLFDVDFMHLKASVGIIVDHKFRRKGLAEAALQELSKFALEQKIHTLWAKCQKWNEASLNLFRKSGFQIVEEQDQFITLRLLL